MTVTELLKKLFGSTEPSQEYIEAITRLADAKVNQRFLNDSASHAKLLSDLMIGRAEKETIIYSKCLKEAYFKDALAKAKGKVRILVDNADAAEWVRALGVHITVRSTSRPIGQHFFVVDGESFRMELDRDPKIAVANFNEPTACSALRKRFDKSWGSAEDIQQGHLEYA